MIECSDGDVLRDSSGLGFGGFLLGLGVGWFLFKTLEISGNVFGWIVILAGAGIIASTLIAWKSPSLNIGGLVGGLMGGLILSLFLTTGFGFFGPVFPGGPLGDYRAEDTRSFSGLMTAGNVYLEVDNFNGFVRVSTWNKDEYKIDIHIKAKGTSDADAEKNIEAYKIDFDESVVQGQGRLILGYDIPVTAHSKYSVGVEAFLPEQASIEVDLTSSNGGIYLNDIDGDSLTIETSNGEIVFDSVSAQTISGETSNGRIKGNLEAPDTFLSTSNGEIELNLQCTVTGEYILRTSNGGIDLEVSPSTDVGYDLDLSTSNGNIDINLPNLEYSLNQKDSKKARTSDFEDKPVRLTIEGDTSNGNIDIET